MLDLFNIFTPGRIKRKLWPSGVARVVQLLQVSTSRVKNMEKQQTALATRRCLDDHRRARSQQEDYNLVQGGRGGALQSRIESLWTYFSDLHRTAVGIRMRPSEPQADHVAVGAWASPGM